MKAMVFLILGFLLGFIVNDHIVVQNNEVNNVASVDKKIQNKLYLNDKELKVFDESKEDYPEVSNKLISMDNKVDFEADGDEKTHFFTGTVQEFAKKISDNLNISIDVEETIRQNTLNMQVNSLSNIDDVKALLNNYDVFVYLPAFENNKNQVKMWIYTKNSGFELYAGDNQVFNNMIKLGLNLKNRDPVLRASAISYLIQNDLQNDLQQILDALRDESDYVRSSILDTVIEKNIILPIDVVEQMIVADKSKSIRMQALSLLEDMTSVDIQTRRSIAESAFNDYDADVRVYAAEVLQTLSENELPPQNPNVVEVVDLQH